jgi:hypothetical protein
MKMKLIERNNKKQWRHYYKTSMFPINYDSGLYFIKGVVHIRCGM